MSRTLPSRARPQDLVAGLPLLARLEEEHRRALARKAILREFAQGAVVFSQGAEADAMYVLVSGELHVILTTADGSEALLALIGPGEACGELGLLDGQARSATVVAARRSQVLAVTRDDFNAWLRRHPQAALALLGTLSLRIRRMNETVADFAFLDVAQRLAKRLADMAETADGRGQVKLTQAELATMLGVSRETINKELNALSRDGSIRLGRGIVHVLDAAALRRLTLE
jgi:CRP-like cAMP-binding protein